MNRMNEFALTEKEIRFLEAYRQVGAEKKMRIRVLLASVEEERDETEGTGKGDRGLYTAE